MDFVIFLLSVVCESLAESDWWSSVGWVADVRINSIADALEEKLNPRLKESFRWRPETAVDRKWDGLQGRFGPDGESMLPVSLPSAFESDLAQC